MKGMAVALMAAGGLILTGCEGGKLSWPVSEEVRKSSIEVSRNSIQPGFGFSADRENEDPAADVSTTKPVLRAAP